MTNNDYFSIERTSYFSFYRSNLPIDLFIDSLIYSFTYLPIYLSVSTYLPTSLPIYLSIYLSTYLSFSLWNPKSIIDLFIHVLIICIYLLLSLASILSNYTCILNRTTDTRFHLQWQKLTPPTKVVPPPVINGVSHEAPKKWPKYMASPSCRNKDIASLGRSAFLLYLLGFC